MAARVSNITVMIEKHGGQWKRHERDGVDSRCLHLQSLKN